MRTLYTSQVAGMGTMVGENQPSGTWVIEFDVQNAVVLLWPGGYKLKQYIK